MHQGNGNYNYPFALNKLVSQMQSDQENREPGKQYFHQAINGKIISTHLAKEKEGKHIEEQVHVICMNKTTGNKTVILVISFYSIWPHDSFGYHILVIHGNK